MTAILISIFAWFMLPMIFWTLSIVFFVWAYKLVDEEDDFSFGAATLIGLLIAALAYRYDAFRLALVSWPQVGYLIGGYVGVGTLVAGYKWMTVLVDFRPKARAWLDRHTDYEEQYPSKAGALSRAVFGSGKDRVIESEGSFYPDYRAFPLTNWTTFWPLFIFSVVLDPLWRATKRAVKWAGLLLERVAKRFSVS